jgi:proteasome component ECM29
MHVQVEDVLFAAGEALSFIWGEVPVTADEILETNFVSLSQATNYLTSDAPLVPSNIYERSGCEEAHAMAREEIIKKLFETLIYSSRKEERCAGTVWLVSLTMYCGRHPKILELLPQIQVFQSIMYINYLQRFLVYALLLSKLQQCKICRSSYHGN